MNVMIKPHVLGHRNIKIYFNNIRELDVVLESAFQNYVVFEKGFQPVETQKIKTSCTIFYKE